LRPQVRSWEIYYSSMKKKNKYLKYPPLKEAISPFSRKNDLLSCDILDNILSCLQSLRSAFGRQGILENPGVSGPVLDFMVTCSLLSVLAVAFTRSIFHIETYCEELDYKLIIPHFSGAPKVVELNSPEAFKTGVKLLIELFSQLKNGLLPLSSLTNIFSVLFESDLLLYGGGLVKFSEISDRIPAETGPFNGKIYHCIFSKSSDEVRAFPSKFPMRILDPACGTGINILSLAEWIQDEEKLLIDDNNFLFYAVDRDSRKLVVSAFIVALNFVMNQSHVAKSGLQICQEIEIMLQKFSSRFICGNILLCDEDFSDTVLSSTLTTETEQLRPVKFSEFVENCGFDLIIGSVLHPFLPEIKEEMAIERRYQTYNRNEGLYPCIIERCFGLLCSEGKLVLAIPDSIIHSKAASDIRAFVADKRLKTIFWAEKFRRNRDSPGSVVLVISNAPSKGEIRIIEGPIFSKSENHSDFAEYYKQNFPVDGKGWDLKDTDYYELISHFSKKGTPLKNILLGKIFEEKLYEDRELKQGSIPHLFQNRRIQVQQSGKNLCFAIASGCVAEKPGTVSIPIIDYYLFGFFNSTVFLTLYFDNKKSGLYDSPFEIINNIPAYSIDPYDHHEKMRENRICALAQMILIMSDTRSTRFNRDFDFLSKRIRLFQESLDRLVLDLYKLDDIQKDVFEKRASKIPLNINCLYINGTDLLEKMI